MTMIKENLSFEERWAISLLIELVRDAHVLVPDNNSGDDDELVTNGEVLDLYTFKKSDWNVCLAAID